ncbi:MAG TPA: c-type cytochrome [Phycisphaerales bacterium]|nr:c-type cytochrome [Phycisphaerales bacterium]
MRAAIILILALAAGGGILYMATSPRTNKDGGKEAPAGKVTKTAAPAPLSDADLRAHGQYLVTIMACNDCHTPHDDKGQPIKDRLLSGHPEQAPLPTWNPSMIQQGNIGTIAPTLTAFATPLGTAVAPNLTPDMETGLLGVMTLDTFAKSFKTGQHWKGGRPILPPMPVGYYKELKDEDVKAIYTYLKSLPAVKNKAPDSTFTPPPGMPAAPAPGH